MSGPDQRFPDERRGDTSPGDDVFDDPVVLEGVRRREREALGRFFDAAFPYVYGLAFRLSGDHAVAQDVAQEVFLKVYRSADRLDPSRHPKPWLTTIAYNAYRDLLRRSAARREDPLESAGGTAHSATEAPDAALERKETVEAVQRAILSLDESLRWIVILRDYSGMPHEEIAQVLGLSHDAVRKRYSRALQKLREILSRERR